MPLGEQTRRGYSGLRRGSVASGGAYVCAPELVDGLVEVAHQEHGALVHAVQGAHKVILRTVIVLHTYVCHSRKGATENKQQLCFGGCPLPPTFLCAVERAQQRTHSHKDNGLNP